MMRWTKELPTEPGWYWVRQKGYGGHPYLVYFRLTHEGVVVDPDGAAPFYYADCQFGGPIPLPEEPV